MLTETTRRRFRGAQLLEPALSLFFWSFHWHLATYGFWRGYLITETTSVMFQMTPSVLTESPIVVWLKQHLLVKPHLVGSCSFSLHSISFGKTFFSLNESGPRCCPCCTAASVSVTTESAALHLDQLSDRGSGCNLTGRRKAAGSEYNYGLVSLHLCVQHLCW